MGATTLAVVVCGALLLMDCGLAMAKPSVESVTYQVELVDHIEDFSVQATTYFSMKHEAYRYDFSGGMSQLFIYPKEGWAYYYYPKSDFPNKQFNITACYSFHSPKLIELISPLPSTDSLPDLGPDHLYDIPVEKYGRTTLIGDNALVHNYEVWVTTKEAKTGIHPIRTVNKLWELTAQGLRKSLYQHTTTEYHGLIVGEQNSSVWDRPSVACTDTEIENIDIIIDMATDIAVLVQLLIPPIPHQSFLNGVPASAKSYKKGRRSPGAKNQDDPLLLDFPWSPEQCVSIAKTLPKSFDWRDFGAVTQVKNQRNCGNCWAHGTVGSLEGAYFLKYKDLVTLSEQAMTDCSGSNIFGTNEYTDGCFGGIERSGFTWIHQTGGIPPAQEYSPFQESNGYCRINDQTKLVAKLDGYYNIPNNTDALRIALVKLGPIVVSIDANNLQPSNFGPHLCSLSNMDHSVLLVGYGESTEDGPYWILKNSWDTTWGHEGYFLMSAKGNCRRILDEAYFPVLSDL